MLRKFALSACFIFVIFVAVTLHNGSLCTKLFSERNLEMFQIFDNNDGSTLNATTFYFCFANIDISKTNKEPMKSIEFCSYHIYSGICLVIFGISYQYMFMSFLYYNDVIMSPMASQITSLTIVYPTVYSGADRRKHQKLRVTGFVRGSHR